MMQCAKWKAEENIELFSYMVHQLNQQHISSQNVYKRRFGNIKGVTDKNYITNSYHVHVTEKIRRF